MSEENVSRRAEFDGLLIQLERKVFEDTLSLKERAHYRAQGIDHISLSYKELAELLGGSYGRWNNLLSNTAEPTATEIMVMKTALSDGFQAAHARQDVVRGSKGGDKYVGARKVIAIRRDGMAPVPYSYENEVKSALDGVFGHRKREYKKLF